VFGGENIYKIPTPTYVTISSNYHAFIDFVMECVKIENCISSQIPEECYTKLDQLFIDSLISCLDTKIMSKQYELIQRISYTVYPYFEYHNKINLLMTRMRNLISLFIINYTKHTVQIKNQINTDLDFSTYPHYFSSKYITLGNDSFYIKREHSHNVKLFMLEQVGKNQEFVDKLAKSIPNIEQMYSKKFIIPCKTNFARKYFPAMTQNKCYGDISTIIGSYL
jgi:hypothetical protein